MSIIFRLFLHPWNYARSGRVSRAFPHISFYLSNTESCKLPWMTVAHEQDGAPKSPGFSFFPWSESKIEAEPAPKYHLLVVDDEGAVRSVIRQYLRARGYEVTTVASGPEAVAKLQEIRFDLVILDLMMPEMDGLEVLQIIRSTHPTLPALIFTGIGFDEDILQEARTKGASGFITKGLPLTNLVTEIRRLLNYP